jgi:MYXO-CTERM domain-containing protein
VIDNFTYTAPAATTATPEPSTWMLGASGLLGLAALRLRSRK